MYVLNDVLHWRGMAKCFAVMGIFAGSGNWCNDTVQCHLPDGTRRNRISTMAAGRTGCSGSRGNHPWGDTTIAAACEKLVPTMSALYLLGCGAVLIRCRADILPALETILHSAFPAESSGRRLCGQHYDNRKALWGCERAVYQ